LGAIAAVAFVLLAIFAAAGYTKEAPPPSRSAPGVAVDGESISLTPDAPQWKTIKLATIVPAGKHWSDPAPARVRVDETRAARVRAPLSGRVTGVFVEIGQRLKKGDKLFSVASGEIADLRADRAKAEVDLEVAHASYERVKALVAAQATAGKELLAAEAQQKQ